MLVRLVSVTVMLASLWLAVAACAPAPTPTPPAATAAATSTPQPASPTASAATPTPQPASETAPASTPASATSTPAASAGGLRTFRIVPEESEASYEVQEQFLNRPAPNKAVGRTRAIEGELSLDLEGQPSIGSNEFAVDLRSLKSDDSRRDQRIRSNWLESDKYPFARFEATGAEGLPERYVEGQEARFKLLGNMQIRDVTRPVTFDVQARLEGDTLSGTATTRLLMKDFGFDPPDILGMLRVEDGVTVTVTFTARASA